MMTLYNHMYTYTTGYCKGSGKRELCNRRGSVSTDSVARQARIQGGGGGSLQRYFLFVFSMTVSLAPFMAFSSISLASMPYTFNQWHSQGSALVSR